MRQVSTISAPMLADVLSRAMAVLREDKDDNGESLRDVHADLYANLGSVLAAAAEAIETEDDIVFPFDPDADPNRCPKCGGLLGDYGCVTVGCDGDD